MKTLTEAQLGPALASSQRAVAVAFVRKEHAPSDELLAALGDVDVAMDLVQLDIDACPRLVEEHRIHKVPELLVWAAGGKKLLARTEGAMRAKEAQSLLAHALTRA